MEDPHGRGVQDGLGSSARVDVVVSEVRPVPFPGTQPNRSRTGHARQVVGAFTVIGKPVGPNELTGPVRDRVLDGLPRHHGDRPRSGTRRHGVSAVPMPSSYSTAVTTRCLGSSGGEVTAGT